MNIGPGSKQSKLCNTIIPSNDHNIPAELWSKPQAMIFPPDYHNSSLARKAKVIWIVLEKCGLGYYYKTQARILGKFFTGDCGDCKKSGLTQDAKQRAQDQVKEAEAHSFFMDPIQSSLNQDCESKASLKSNTLDQVASRFICCGHKALGLQSDFCNEKPTSSNGHWRSRTYLLISSKISLWDEPNLNLLGFYQTL